MTVLKGLLAMPSAARPVLTVPDAHTRSARLAATAALSVSALLLTACGGGDEAAADEEAPTAADEQERPDEPAEEEEEDTVVEADAGLARQLSSIPSLDFTEVGESTENLAEAPQVRLRVAQTTTSASLPAEVAEEFMAVDSEVDEVHAADGEEFVVAVVSVTDPEWEPRNADGWLDSTAQFRLQGNAVDVVQFDPTASSSVQETFIFSAPEGAAPEDLTVELETDGQYQEVSLIDGSRLSSDVEHIYQRATGVEVADNGWEHQIDGMAESKPLRGEVVSAEITPAYPGEGWANPGNVYLYVTIDAVDVSGSEGDDTSAFVQLPDGTTVQPDNDPSSLVNAFDDAVLFQVPADAKSATVVIEPAASNAFNDFSWDSTEVELTFTAGTDAPDDGDDEDEDENQDDDDQD